MVLREELMYTVIIIDSKNNLKSTEKVGGNFGEKIVKGQ